jgi:hypothetical protein
MKLPVNYRQVIEELGEVERKLEPYDKLAKRRKELRGQVSKWAEQLSPEASKTLDGVRYAVAIGPQRLERRIKSMARTAKLLGMKLFYSLCSLPLKALEDHLSENQLRALVAEERTGHREIVTMPRLAAERKAAA